MRHMDCKVVAPVDLANKVVGPAPARVGIVSIKFDLFDIQVELAATRVEIVAAMVDLSDTRVGWVAG